MAIGPKSLNKDFLAEVDFFENSIDSMLSKKSLSYGSYVNISIPISMSRDHFIILRERYIEAGWEDVKWNSDQREGDWLTFYSPKQI
jgi:hypothetical protein